MKIWSICKIAFWLFQSIAASIVPLQGTKEQPGNLVSTVHATDAAVLRKRTDYAYSRHQARVKYVCPFNGMHWKTFKWQAAYNFRRQKLELDGIIGIERWDHAIAIANNFTTRIHTVVYEVNGDFCCAYTYAAQIIGTVFMEERDIGTEMWTSSPDEATRIKITEICVHISGRVCPLPGGGDAREHDCEVKEVVQHDV